MIATAAAITVFLMRLGPFWVAQNRLYGGEKITPVQGVHQVGPGGGTGAGMRRKYKKRDDQLRPRLLHFCVESQLLPDSIL